MSIQWLFELQEFGKLFCFSDHRQLIPLICNPTSHNQLSRWVQFTCTLKYHLRWTPRRLAWRILTLCCEWKHERQHIFQYSESSNVPLTQNSMRIKLFESWEICTFLFGSDRRQFISVGLHTRFDFKLLVEKRRNLQNIFLQSEWWPPTWACTLDRFCLVYAMLEDFLTSFC